LRTQWLIVNRKRIQRLIREMGLSGLAPAPATSVKHPHPGHKFYPYLFRGVPVTRPNLTGATPRRCLSYE
jgi:putative transposase